MKPYYTGTKPLKIKKISKKRYKESMKNCILLIRVSKEINERHNFKVA
jgi:hypothetical protein